MDEKPTKFDVLYGFENCRPEFAVKLTPETRWEWVVLHGESAFALALVVG